MFALQANTLDAPTLMIQEYNENFLLKKSGRQSQLTDRQVQTYLNRNMRFTSVERVTRMAKLINKLAKENHLPAGLILSVIKVESNFQPWAVSPRGALGLMQVMPETGEWLAKRFNMPWHGPALLLDEQYNATLGVRYLAYLRDKYRGDLKKILSAYNRGPGKVDFDVSEGKSLTLEYYDKIKQYLPRLAQANYQPNFDGRRVVQSVQ